jgi:hypothetical protein
VEVMKNNIYKDKDLNITEITRLNIDNNIKYIYIGKDKKIKLDYK